MHTIKAANSKNQNEIAHDLEMCHAVIELTVCCGVRSRTLALYTGVRRFEYRGGRTSFYISWLQLRSIYKSWNSGSESTLNSNLSLFWLTRSTTLKTIARPYSIYGRRAKYCSNWFVSRAVWHVAPSNTHQYHLIMAQKLYYHVAISCLIFSRMKSQIYVKSHSDVFHILTTFELQNKINASRKNQGNLIK